MVAHQILVLIVGVRILPGETWSLRLTVRTVDSHSTNRGSIPLGTVGFAITSCNCKTCKNFLRKFLLRYNRTSLSDLFFLAFNSFLFYNYCFCCDFFLFWFAGREANGCTTVYSMIFRNSKIP